MAKIYFKKEGKISRMHPKRETISFLLQFSQALSYIKIKGKQFEMIAN